MFKQSVFIILILFFVSFVYSQSISIVSPAKGDTWVKGRKYTIRWTRSGSMNDFVKIRLYQGNSKVLGIVDRTDNDGSYDWTVPDNINPGTYRIRVKTVDNQIYDDSENFEIKKGNKINVSNLKGLKVKTGFKSYDFPELKVYGASLKFTHEHAGEVNFHVAVTNEGRVEARKLSYIIKINGPHGDKYDKYTFYGSFPYPLPPKKSVELDKKFILKKVGSYVFTFIVNPDHKSFVEYDYSNNEVIKGIYFSGAPDLIVLILGVLPRSREFAHVRFLVKNIGKKSSSPCKLWTNIEDNGVKFFDVPGIKPGGEVSFYRDARWSPPPDKKVLKKLYAIIDYYNEVKEIDEKNNRTSLITRVIKEEIRSVWF